MQPLTISHIDFLPFQAPLVEPLVIGGVAIHERRGFYVTVKTAEGWTAQSEAAPLEGVSAESAGRLKHDIKQMRSYVHNLQIPSGKEQLLEMLRQEDHLLNASASMRFAMESAFLILAAQAAGMSLAEFLGASFRDVETAGLLHGSHQKVVSDFKELSARGVKVFKLKVGDRNIALDVKKVNEIRSLMKGESHLRLDANRQWTFQEACIFAELTGDQRIDFIEEPLHEPARNDAFFQKTRMRIGLDETLQVAACGVRAPGRCSPPLAQQEGVIAYVLKPMILGLIPTLDWMEQARALKRKAIISSVYESTVGLKILANLACLSGQIAGLGTERWLKNTKPISEGGVIKKEFLV